MSETKRPVVYDSHCPFDHEIDFYNVLVVGDKAKATHEALYIEIGPDGIERVAVKALDETSSKEGILKRQKAANSPKYTRVTGGAVWTGESARQMMESGKPLMHAASLLDEPDFEKVSEDMRLRERGQRKKARGILKHGPYGSGEAGPCDADCAKCASEMHGLADRIFLDAQRESPTPRMLAACEKAEASSRWSAQLRLKVEEQKKRDAEAARYTPYWSPEEQSGGDL